MKYGETLRERSIPGWSTYNIDYDDIKLFIKRVTTPGGVKDISLPGHGDDRLVDTERALYQVFLDQHQRIALFVRSKSGEIQRRLDHAKKQCRQLSTPRTVADRRGLSARSKQFSRLEDDVLKAGEELRSLARFTSAQRTAFRKLLKKYKKWTGSTTLEDRVCDEIVDNPKSFTKMDFGPMLDEYSETLRNIRGLAEARANHGISLTRNLSGALNSLEFSSLDRLSSSLTTSSKVDFDVALDTVSLGDDGCLASYFVHPENIVELQIWLLQYFQYYKSRSQANSIATTPIASIPRPGTAGSSRSQSEADYYLVVADNCDRFAQEQASVTVNERENISGVLPQKAKLCIRWNSEDDPILSARFGHSWAKVASIKNKHIDTFFDRNATLPRRKTNDIGKPGYDLHSIREDIMKDPLFKPLYRITTCRSRFTGLNNDDNAGFFAILDTSVTMMKYDDTKDGNQFPFALLQIRQEGVSKEDILNVLDRSHLVERVRGFSLQYHALWQITQPANISPPLWMPLLSRDIRKLPPPALPHDSVPNSPMATQLSFTNSSMGITDSTTAIDTGRPSSSGGTADGLGIDTSTLAGTVRKKRRRRQPLASTPLIAPQQKYWNEYDHPEDGNEGDAFVLYIDPNGTSSMDRFFEKISALFYRRSSTEHFAPSTLPNTPKEDEPSSDDDNRTSHHFSERNYGTVNPNHTNNITTYARAHSVSGTETAAMQSLPTSSPLAHPTICLTASVIIQVIAFFLATTSRRKLVREVDFIALFAIVSSLAFALVGTAALWRSRSEAVQGHIESGVTNEEEREDNDPRRMWWMWITATIVVAFDVICSGGLLARMVG